MGWTALAKLVGFGMQFVCDSPVSSVARESQLWKSGALFRSLCGPMLNCEQAAMASNPVVKLTEDEYLAIERAAEFKSEFIDGEMFAMSGGSPRHARLQRNLSSNLGVAIRVKAAQVSVPT